MSECLQSSSQEIRWYKGCFIRQACCLSELVVSILFSKEHTISRCNGNSRHHMIFLLLFFTFSSFNVCLLWRINLFNSIELVRFKGTYRL